MYWHDMYVFPDSIEHEYKYAGRYGARGESRAPRRKPTPEQIRRQNRKNREIKYRRLIKLNFKQHDLWVTCKYPAGDRPDVEEVRKDLQHFLQKVRYQYKKRLEELKFIYRMEIGAKGGIHFHILINRIINADTDIIIEDAWSKTLKESFKRRGVQADRTAGLTDHRTTYNAGGYEGLANYICKEPSKETEEYVQLSMFEPEEKKKLLSVQCSRNLIRPAPIRKEYKHWTMRRVLADKLKPTEGYQIDEDSIYRGINPYNGWTYCKYTEYRIGGAPNG